MVDRLSIHSFRDAIRSMVMQEIRKNTKFQKGMGSSWEKWVPQWWHKIRKGRYTIEEGEKEHLTFQHIFIVTYEWACRIRIQRSQTYLMWIHLPVLLKWHLWVHKSSVIKARRRAKDLRNTSPQDVGLCSSFWVAVTEYHRPSASQWQTYSSQTWRLEVQDLCASVAEWGHGLFILSHVEEGKGISLGSLTVMDASSRRAQPSGPHLIPKSPAPNVISLGIGFLTWISKGHKHSDHSKGLKELSIMVPYSWA